MAKKIKTTKKSVEKKTTQEKSCKSQCKKPCSSKAKKVCEKNNSCSSVSETNSVETKGTNVSLCQRVLGWFFSQTQDDSTTEFYRRNS